MPWLRYLFGGLSERRLDFVTVLLTFLWKNGAEEAVA
jgi:hypothetical protein